MTEKGAKMRFIYEKKMLNLGFAFFFGAALLS